MVPPRQHFFRVGPSADREKQALPVLTPRGRPAVAER